MDMYVSSCVIGSSKDIAVKDIVLRLVHTECIAETQCRKLEML